MKGFKVQPKKEESDDEYGDGYSDGFDSDTEQGKKPLGKMNQKLAKITANPLKFAVQKGPNKLNQAAGGFAKSKGIILTRQVDQSAANEQEVRAEQLREMITLETSDHTFSLQSQTPFDLYYEKLNTGKIMNMQI